MTRGTRRILFLFFLVLFLLTAPTLILYFQGYRFDFENKKLTQTGGLFLKATPKQVEIYLTGKLIKKTDFFFGSALIDNLLPKKYKVEVKKEGYFSWEKNLEIREKEVTEVKNIILFPENPSFDILSKGVENFWFSPNEKKIILQEKEGNSWTLKLYDLDKKLKSQLLKESDISKKGAEIFGLEFSKDSKEIFLEVGVGEELKYFTSEIEKTPPLLKTSKEPLPALENILVEQTLDDEIYYLDNSGQLFKTDSSFKSKEKMTEIAFSVKEETDYELKVFPEYIFLREGEILYIFNPDSKSFEKFFEGIRGLKISPDNKKVVYFSDFEIWVLFLKEKWEQPVKKAGERLFLVRLSEKIKDVFWTDSNHLIFNSGENIKITEIDERDRINIVNTGKFAEPEIFFNQSDKKLYVLSRGNLFISEKLLP